MSFNYSGGHQRDSLGWGAEIDMKRRKAFPSIFFVIALVSMALLTIGGIFWNVYSYRECRSFGHTVLYCIRGLGR